MTFKQYLTENDYETYKNEKKKINDKVDKLSDTIKQVSGGSSVDVSDEIRNSPKFKKAKNDYDKAFKELQKFNKDNRKWQKKDQEERRKSWKK